MSEEIINKPVGRPKGEETDVIAIRVLKKHKEFIKPLVKQFVKEIKLPEDNGV